MNPSKRLGTTLLLPLLIPLMLVAFAAIVLTGKMVLLSSFESLERQFNAKIAERALEYLDSQVNQLENFASDRGAWSEAYLNINNPKWYEQNYHPEIAQKAHIQFALILDHTQKSVFSASYELGTRKSKVDPNVLAAFEHSPQALKQSGIIETGSGLFIYATSPILKSDGKGPRAGTLVLGRILDSIFILELAQRMDQRMELLTSLLLPLDSQVPYLSLEEDRHLVTYLPLRPVNSTKIHAIKMISQKTISNQGAVTFWTTALSTMFISLLLTAGILVVFRKKILTPIASLTDEIELVLDQANLSRRVNQELPGEIGVLAQSLNKLLESNELQAARLVYKSRMATMGEMAAGFAHDVNNRLAVILARTEMLEDEAKENTLSAETVLTTCKKIIQMSDRITLLVKGLRAFSRNPAEDPVTTTTVSNIMEQTLSLTVERMKSHEINFEIGEIPSFEVKCRIGHMIQVLINVIANAHDAVYKTPDAWIKINFDRFTEGTDQKLRIQITDSGQLIPKDLHSKLGKPFFTTKDPAKNVGLGIMTSREILTQYGGTLRFDETHAHTCFVIELPLAQATAQPKSVTAA